MSERFSFPKTKIKVLLLEGIHQSAVDEFHRHGYKNVELLPRALTEQELLKVLPDVHILGIRSATHLTAPVIRAAERLLAVGCFCIGTNQVDLAAAKKSGVPVFNAPFSNTRSVAELVAGHIVYLLRDIPRKNALAHRGKWLKSAADSHEVRGKTLGIIGYGRIGTQVGVLAEALGMKVIFYDPVRQLPMGNAKAATSLKHLLGAADIVTLHVPDNDSTRQLIGAKEINQMSPGSRLINLARGKVVDIPAAVKALKSGHLSGGAFDVFPVEPGSNDQEFVSELREFDNVVLTPHIGGSTAEAQVNIGNEVADKLITYSDNGSTNMAVNFPVVSLPALAGQHRLLHIHHNQPGVLSSLNEALAASKANITGQYLQTDADIGYVVTDVDAATGTLDRKALEAVPGTIKTRILY